MRLSYPRSFLSLLLIGFTLVAAPLVAALFSNAVTFERLAALSEQAVLQAVKATQASRGLTGNLAALERSARQYALAGEQTFLEAYRTNRAAARSMSFSDRGSGRSSRNCGSRSTRTLSASRLNSGRSRTNQGSAWIGPSPSVGSVSVARRR